MTMMLDLVGQTGMQYFGRITASTSHELKNALAIIKENAGLLSDYLLMAEKGRPLEPQRLKTVAGRIEDQTLRADNLIKNMNRFAHSVDEPKRTVNLNELTELLVALSHREAAMRQIALEVRLPDFPAALTSAPFLLLTLLGHCLTFALNGATPGKSLTLRVQGSDKDVNVYFEQLDGLTKLTGHPFPNEREVALLKILGASVGVDHAAGTISVTIAKT